MATVPMLHECAESVLRHDDLSESNIFVARGDPTTVTSIIDWQFVTARPLFLQAIWPLFLEPPPGYETGPVQPKMPAFTPGYLAAIASFRRAAQSKIYESAIATHHERAYDALTEIDDEFRNLFTRPELTYSNGVVPLRKTLITMAHSWQRSDHFTEPCPVTFTPAEEYAHDEASKQYIEWQESPMNNVFEDYLSIPAEDRDRQ
jgi:hypothetical protein